MYVARNLTGEISGHGLNLMVPILSLRMKFFAVPIQNIASEQYSLKDNSGRKKIQPMPFRKATECHTEVKVT